MNSQTFPGFQKFQKIGNPDNNLNTNWCKCHFNCFWAKTQSKHSNLNAICMTSLQCLYFVFHVFKAMLCCFHYAAHSKPKSS